MGATDQVLDAHVDIASRVSSVERARQKISPHSDTCSAVAGVVGAGSAIEPVSTGATMQHVVPATAIELVIPGIAVQPVVASPARYIQIQGSKRRGSDSWFDHGSDGRFDRDGQCAESGHCRPDKSSSKE